MDWRSATFQMLVGDTYDTGTGVIHGVDHMADNFEKALYALKDHGINTVTLNWYVPVNPITGEIEDSYAPNAPSWFLGMPSISTVQLYTDIAHRHGMKVVWKPNLTTNDASGGAVSDFYAPGVDVANFLNEAKDFWANLSPYAEQSNVDLMIIGAEHQAYAGPAYDAEWRDIISEIRSRYSGELTYSAVAYMLRNTSAVDDLSFWDALDYIGVSMYLPLHDGTSGASLANAYTTLSNNHIYPTIRTPLVNVPDELDKLATTFGKDVIFTEAGANSVFGTLDFPPNSTGTADTLEQSILYAAHLDTFSQYSWFQGINWWTNLGELGPAPGQAYWDTHISNFNWGFDFLSKASGDVVRAFWADGRDGAPLEGDIFFGGEGNDVLTGGPLGDLLVANRRDDTIYAGDGDDRVFGGGGADQIFGENGHDLIYGGTSFRDLADSIDAGAGNDLVFGHLGNDTLLGQSGDDTLLGGAGSDWLDGGADADRLIDAIGSNTLIGGTGNDSAAGHLGGNAIDGNAGADILVGGVGADALDGGTDGDLLVGDIVAGLGAGDTLTGGTGNDLLQGGLGADEFHFAPNDGNDVIAVWTVNYATPGNSQASASDFVSGHDEIHLTGFGYSDGAEAFANVSNVNGQAVFSDQGTSITFVGLTVSDLDASDFFVF